MKFDSNLAAVHAYLCADGYVIKNPETQKHKYYHIALRNTNLTLLEDFQKKFYNVFGVSPKITNGRCIIHSKELFYVLTKEYCYYSYKWTLPKLTTNTLKLWLRAFFDCEGWVELQKAKSRSIRTDSVNLKGLTQVQMALRRFEIKSTIKKSKKNLWRLSICGFDDIKKYAKNIGFLHPSKKQRLKDVLTSYKSYKWTIPTEKNELIKFLYKQGKIRKERNELRLFSIKRGNIDSINESLRKCGIDSKVQGPWKNNTGSLYFCLVLKEDKIKVMQTNGS